VAEIAKGEMLLALPGEIRAQLSQAVEPLDAAVPTGRLAVGFASCHHGTGTSSMAWSFAGALAAAGRHPVCLVEANLRTPALADALRLQRTPGLREVLDGSAGLDAAIQQPPGHGVSVMTAGAIAGAAASAFSGPALGETVERLRERFRAVLFDAAPLLPYPDTVPLARHLDGIVLVLRAEHDRWEVAQQGARMLEAAGVRILGAVLNRKPLYIPRWLYRFL
jgi:Mrp family chromosome partitioning ATPase